MACVRDVMKKGITAAKIHESISQISKALAIKKISNMPVVDSKGVLVGIVSEQDIIKAMGSGNFMKLSAGDIMTKKVLSVKENDSLELVAKIFIEKPYRRIPVTRNKKVVGIITREDIISNFIHDYY